MTTTTPCAVSFLAVGSDEHVWLTLDSDWTTKGGLQPDVNTATIPAAERAKLPTNLVSVVGRIVFWGDVDPVSGGVADHVVYNQWLIDCVVADYGSTPSNGLQRPLAYTLSFADHRHGFLPPRGGRLC